MRFAGFKVSNGQKQIYFHYEFLFDYTVNRRLKVDSDSFFCLQKVFQKCVCGFFSYALIYEFPVAQKCSVGVRMTQKGTVKDVPYNIF